MLVVAVAWSSPTVLRLLVLLRRLRVLLRRLRLRLRALLRRLRLRLRALLRRLRLRLRALLRRPLASGLTLRLPALRLPGPLWTAGSAVVAGRLIGESVAGGTEPKHQDESKTLRQKRT
jgi:hypothetical protein